MPIPRYNRLPVPTSRRGPYFRQAQQRGQGPLSTFLGGLSQVTSQIIEVEEKRAMARAEVEFGNAQAEAIAKTNLFQKSLERSTDFQEYNNMWDKEQLDISNDIADGIQDWQAREVFQKWWDSKAREVAAGVKALSWERQDKDVMTRFAETYEDNIKAGDIEAITLRVKTIRGLGLISEKTGTTLLENAQEEINIKKAKNIALTLGYEKGTKWLLDDSKLHTVSRENREALAKEVQNVHLLRENVEMVKAEDERQDALKKIVLIVDDVTKGKQAYTFEDLKREFGPKLTATDLENYRVFFASITDSREQVRLKGIEAEKKEAYKKEYDTATLEIDNGDITKPEQIDKILSLTYEDRKTLKKYLQDKIDKDTEATQDAVYEEVRDIVIHKTALQRDHGDKLIRVNTLALGEENAALLYKLNEKLRPTSVIEMIRDELKSFLLKGKYGNIGAIMTEYDREVLEDPSKAEVIKYNIMNPLAEHQVRTVFEEAVNKLQPWRHRELKIEAFGELEELERMVGVRAIYSEEAKAIYADELRRYIEKFGDDPQGVKKFEPTGELIWVHEDSTKEEPQEWMFKHKEMKWIRYEQE